MQVIKFNFKDQEECMLENPYYLSEGTEKTIIDRFGKMKIYRVERFYPNKNPSHYTLIWKLKEIKENDQKKIT